MRFRGTRDKARPREIARLLKRLLIVLIATIVTIILVEGLYSLITARSLRSLFTPQLQDYLQPTDADRVAAAARTPGSLRAHPDPRVGNVTKANHAMELARATVHTDQLGMRVRPGPEPIEDSPRIVILGDSVAFGQGLEDQETIAHRLETMLNEVRGPDSPSVVAYTVAVPGWNFRNSIRFLLDHLDVYQPDIVVFVPVANDLANTDSVTEAGHRRAAPDIYSPDPALPVSGEGAAARVMYLAREMKAGSIARLSSEALGPSAIRSDLTLESSRRFDDLAATLIVLKTRLERTAGRLLLLPYNQDPFHWHLRRRLLRSGVQIAVIPALGEPLPSDTLGYDPHPNPTTSLALATWVAEFLLEEGLLDQGRNDPLPKVPEDLNERRVRAITDEEAAELSAAAIKSAAATVRPVIDVRTGASLRQVYAGLTAGGRVGNQFLAVLPGRGSELQVQLRPLGGRPDLYPLAVHVDWDGRRVGSVRLEADAGEKPVLQSFSLSESSRSTPVEIRLRADDWVVIQEDGKSVTASFTLDFVRIADQ